MGSGSSCNKVEKFDKSCQIPSVFPIKASPSPPVRKPSDLLFPGVSAERRKPRPSIHEGVFELDPNIEDYSSIWDHETKLSSTFQQSFKSDLEHHQKETSNNKWSKKSSINFESTHIESFIDTQTHSSIHISSSEKIDELIQNLNRSHLQLDDIIKRRTEQISTETEFVLSHILNETQQKQQRLLNYAKERQLKQDENYQKSLEEFLSQLDQIKAKHLSDLQNQLQIYREEILQESQLKIITVNEQANIIKGKILQEEQQQATKKIDSIINQIQKISSDEKLQYLGSESITKTNILTNTKVGTKALGQTSIFDSGQNGSSQPRPPSNKPKIKT